MLGPTGPKNKDVENRDWDEPYKLSSRHGKQVSERHEVALS